MEKRGGHRAIAKKAAKAEDRIRPKRLSAR